MEERDDTHGGPAEVKANRDAPAPPLAELVDVPLLQSMMDDFYYLTHIPMALIDAEGAVLIAAGWQDVCVHFHRANPETCKYCIESDTMLTLDIPEGVAQLYQCKNGMWDAAVPIIIDGHRLGNLFTGQFFFDDEPVDREYFRRQAERYDFNEADYLDAIDRAPRLSHRAVETGLRFLKNLSSMISQLSLTNVERERALQAEREAQIANARLYEQERKVARLNEALTLIDNSIHSTLEIDEMLERAVVEAAEALECESSALDMREEGRWVVRHAYQFTEGAIGRSFTDAEMPFAALAAADKAPVIIADAFSDPRVDPKIQRAYNVRSVMVTPLIVHGDVIALLFFNYHKRTHAFAPEEVAFARRLSTSLGLAIETARLYSAEHEIADQLQAALLSMPGQVPGIEFAHTYRAAGDAGRVGGDFYDLFELDADRVGLMIGDIAGKGLDAAVLTSMVKHTIRAHANEQGKTPQRILELANTLVYRATLADSFATVFFGILDRRDGRLCYANAGHVHPLLRTSAGEVVALPTTGPLLGAFPDAGFEEAEARMESGCLLLLYTDGLTEARERDGFYGEQRLSVAFGQAGSAPAEDIVKAVVDDALAFSHGVLRDDLAVLAVRRS